MNRSKIRNPKCHANPPARPAMSYPGLEQIMARTRGQRAGGDEATDPPRFGEGRRRFWGSRRLGVQDPKRLPQLGLITTTVLRMSKNTLKSFHPELFRISL